MIPRGNVHSSKLAQRRRRIFFIKLGFFAFLFILSICTLAFLLRNERITIARVYAEGNSAITTEDLQSIVRDKISGSYFFLIPKNNILFYPRQSIEGAIAAAFPRLNFVSVSGRDLTSLTVKV